MANVELFKEGVEGVRTKGLKQEYDINKLQPKNGFIKLRINPYSAKGLGDWLYTTLHKIPGEVGYSFCLFLKS